jgi:hypothetical protein
MITPAQYQHQLSEMDLSALEQGGEALSTLEEKLREIERGVNQEMHVLRAQYQARLTAARAGSSSQVMVSNKSRPGSKKRDEEALRIENERDSKLAPYAEVKDKVDELLAKVEAARSQP